MGIILGLGHHLGYHPDFRGVALAFPVLQILIS